MQIHEFLKLKLSVVYFTLKRESFVKWRKLSRIFKITVAPARVLRIKKKKKMVSQPLLLDSVPRCKEEGKKRREEEEKEKEYFNSYDRSTPTCLEATRIRPGVDKKDTYLTGE